MQFGMFMEFATRSGGSEAEAFREGLALAVAADGWGLDAAWLAEFHFVPDRSVLSSPITLAAAIAGRTRRIRIGFAVYVLPLSHPIRIAEEIATLDHVSGGRVDLGIGRSGFTWFYEGYAVPYAESQGRFDEAVEVLRLAWRGERFSFEGEFYRVSDALLCPRPRQQPHPPLRMAATRGGDLPAGRCGRASHLRRPSRRQPGRARRAARVVPGGVARGRPSRSSERLPPAPAARGGDRPGGARGGAGHPRPLLQAPERARGERCGPPRRPARLTALRDGRPPRRARL